MKDNIAGLAIDLADINYIFMKWFDGTYHDILEWKEKAQRWSTHEAVAYSRAMDFTKTWIENDKLTKLEEKAKMWDEGCIESKLFIQIADMCENNGISVVAQVERWKEKSKKWDSHQRIWENDLHINKERLTQLETKAERWDKLIELVRFDNVIK